MKNFDNTPMKYTTLSEEEIKKFAGTSKKEDSLSLSKNGVIIDGDELSHKERLREIRLDSLSLAYELIEKGRVEGNPALISQGREDIKNLLERDPTLVSDNLELEKKSIPEENHVDSAKDEINDGVEKKTQYSWERLGGEEEKIKLGDLYKESTENQERTYEDVETKIREKISHISTFQELGNACDLVIEMLKDKGEEKKSELPENKSIQKLNIDHETERFIEIADKVFKEKYYEIYQENPNEELYNREKERESVKSEIENSFLRSLDGVQVKNQISVIIQMRRNAISVVNLESKKFIAKKYSDSANTEILKEHSEYLDKIDEISKKQYKESLKKLVDGVTEPKYKDELMNSKDKYIELLKLNQKEFFDEGMEDFISITEKVINAKYNELSEKD